MNIRIAKKHDLDNIFPLSKQLAITFSVEYESFKNSFLKNLDNEVAIVIVAEIDKEIIGYL